MNDLLVKYLLQETTPQEAHAVQEWIAESEANRKQYLQFKKLWDESRQLASRTVVDEDAAWLRLKSRMQQQGEAPAQAPVIKARTGWPLMRIAALFVLLAGAIWWMYDLEKPQDPVQILAMETSLQPLADTLPDGSVVTLNKKSKISYPSRFEGDTRSVTLEGEAFFEVTPNTDQPFVITVNDVTVRVLGTSFNIRSEGGTTEVIVETGKVQVERHNKVAELKPKEKIVVHAQDTVLQKEVVADQLHNYYRTKEFVCDNTPLWKLVTVLNEAYGSNIVIGKNSLRSLPLNTTFNNESLDNILLVISETFQIEVVRTEGQIILK